MRSHGHLLDADAGRARRPELSTVHSVYPYLFLPRSDHPRALHSFPTRRSSDLTNVSESDVGRVREEQPATFTVDAYRSEEHTSELQSHHDLVCRLLLEKKK